MRIYWGAMALMFALAAPALADVVESEARTIEAMLVAPCCWSQQVSLHQSEAAEEIKRDIRVALKAGRTRQQIVDAYVERYGPRILIEPPARGFATWLYVLPVVTFLASAGGLAFVVKRFAARGRPAASASADERVKAGDAHGDMADKLEDELREMD